MKRKFTKILVGLCLITGFASLSLAQTESPAVWQQRFKMLSSGLSRVQAEQEIENVRKVKSTYQLWAMDTSSSVVYKLDDTTILWVSYKPGIPAAHVSSGPGGHPPVDGVLLEYKILPLN